MLNIVKNLNCIFEILVILIIIITIIKNLVKILRHNTNKDNKIKIEKLIEEKYKIVFGVLVIIAIITRTYKVENILNGLHADEAGMGYDAYCIANFGVDRFLNKLPVYMINFGGGQSALYTYIAAICVKILGLNIVSIRMPGIILSMVAIILGFLLVKECCGKKSALTFMALMIACPWHIMQSRFGLDCNLLSSMIIISIYSLIVSKKWWQYLITGIFFGISLYTYALSYLIIPILLLFTLIYMLYTKKIKFINIVIMGIPIALLALPLMLLLLVNNGFIEQINWIITIPRIYNYRAGEIGLKNIAENILNLRSIFTADKFIYNSIKEFGTIYLFAIPLLLLGISISCVNFIINIKNKKFNLGAIMLFLFIANIIVILLTPTNVNKANSIYIAAIYFIYLALRYIYSNLKLGYTFISAMYIVMFMLFIIYYFGYYNNDNPSMELVNNELVGLYERLDELDMGNNIYMELKVTQPWIYKAFQSRVSPYDLNNTKHEDTVDYWTNMVSYANLYWGLPESLDYDGIFVFVENAEDEIENDLIYNGYNKEIYGRYVILYKSE